MNLEVANVTVMATVQIEYRRKKFARVKSGGKIMP